MSQPPRRAGAASALALLAASLLLAPTRAAPAALAPPDTLARPGVAAARPDSQTNLAAPPSTFLSEETELHLLAPQTAHLRLAHRFVAAGSVRAVVDGRVWEAPDDFRVSGREGLWLPQRPLGPPDGGPVLVRLSYRFLPVPVAARRDLREPVAGVPGASQQARPGAGEGAGTEAPASGVTGGAGDLTVRGSKSVRLASGNRRELVVDQTLRLAIEGRLTPEITVRAALSDDNLPVVPEGNTEELRDVDKVLVELEAPTWRATLGDFVAARGGTRFGDYRRKLQGVSLIATPGPGRVGALAGSPRGAYRTLQIRGQERNQGPYRLGGGETGDNLFIVAGSERVMLDGEALTRGADRDYVIDYVRGAVTFTYRRLITAESTIVVEFEEGEGAYVRTVAGGEASLDFNVPLGDGLPGEFGARFTQERDDPLRLRGGELGDEERVALAAAGDDPALAVASGVSETTLGEGHYRREVVDGREIFVWDTLNGAYDLNFFFAGTGQGDYGLDSLTVAGARAFGWRGTGGGSYRLGRQLPLPQRQSVATLTARLGPLERPRLNVEWNAGRFDRNAASALDDGDNAGVTWAAAAQTGEGELRLGGRGLGRVSLSAQHENRDSRFRPFLLRRDLFSYDRWGLGGRANRIGFLEERDVESTAAGLWMAGEGTRLWRLGAQWGRLSHGPSLTASRVAVDGTWRRGAWDGASLWEEARAADAVEPLAVLRRRQRHQAGWTGPLCRPSVQYELDQWADGAARPAAAGGSRLRRWRAALEAAPGHALRWRAGFERGLADSLRVAVWARERDARTWQLQLSAPPVAGVRAQGEGVLRRVLGLRDGEQTTRLARLNLAGAWPRLGSDWSLGYGVDNSRSELLDRQVVFVGTRQGDYNQDGDFLGRNQGDYNVIYAGTDSLVATTEVSGDLTWRQNFAVLGRERPWGRWSTLTHLAARGRSRTERVGELLRFAPAELFDPELVLLGEVSLRQEVNLLQGWGGNDLRLRYDFDQARDRQYAAHPEDRLRRAYQGTFTRNVSERITLQMRSGRTRERRETPSGAFGASRAYDAQTWRHEGEWSLRPGAGNRLALTAELIKRDDAVSGVRQDEWAVRPSARWRLERRWSGNLELRWAQVTSDEPAGVVRPYFFAYPGVNREASVRVAWDPTAQLTVAAVYFGRQLGGRGWQHDVRVESTARF